MFPEPVLFGGLDSTFPSLGVNASVMNVCGNWNAFYTTKKPERRRVICLPAKGAYCEMEVQIEGPRVDSYVFLKYYEVCFKISVTDLKMYKVSCCS